VPTALVDMLAGHSWTFGMSSKVECSRASVIVGMVTRTRRHVQEFVLIFHGTNNGNMITILHGQQQYIIIDNLTNNSSSINKL
jgi:hypothetical protein